MPNNVFTEWRKIAATRIPMIAPLLFAASYSEEAENWPAGTGDDGTMMVNSDTLEILYSPKFVAKNTLMENSFVLAHEGLHILCRHTERREKMRLAEGELEYRQDLFTLAAEIAVNSLCESDRKSTRLNSSHLKLSRMPSSA